MKVSNLQVWLAREPLETLIAEMEKAQPIPVKAAYRLMKLGRKLGPHVALIDEVRVKLIKEYGTPGENGQIVVKPESKSWEKFAAAWNELLGEDVELDSEKTILPLDEKYRANILVGALAALEPFLEVE